MEIRREGTLLFVGRPQPGRCAFRERYAGNPQRSVQNRCARLDQCASHELRAKTRWASFLVNTLAPDQTEPFIKVLTNWTSLL